MLEQHENITLPQMHVRSKAKRHCSSSPICLCYFCFNSLSYELIQHTRMATPVERRELLDKILNKFTTISFEKCSQFDSTIWTQQMLWLKEIMPETLKSFRSYPFVIFVVLWEFGVGWRNVFPWCGCLFALTLNLEILSDCLQLLPQRKHV